MKVVLRPAIESDAVTAGAICHSAFKSIAESHRFPPDFPDAATATSLISHLLGRSDIYGVTAESDGRVVASNFLWEGDPVAGVGPITVDPAVQNGGIGRQLMEAVLTRARERGIDKVRLVQAAYHARSLALYTRLGFEAREPLSLLQGPAINRRLNGHRVRPATPGDLDACNALCQRIHGHPRTTELRNAIAQGTAMVVERDAQLTGYTTGMGFFGHAVGVTNDDILALIGAAPTFQGPGMLVPTRNATLMRWCLDNGLHIVQPMTLMSMGDYTNPQGAFLPSILY